MPSVHELLKSGAAEPRSELDTSRFTSLLERRKRFRTVLGGSAVVAAMMILAAAVVWTRTDRPARVVAASPDETTTPPPQPAPLVVEAPSQIGAPVLSLVLTDGALWASTNTDVLRIDPDTKQVVGRLRPQTQAPQALGGGRLLWTGSQLLLGADGTVDGDPALAGVGGWLGRIEPPDQFRLLQVLREDGANFRGSPTSCGGVPTSLAQRSMSGHGMTLPSR